MLAGSFVGTGAATGAAGERRRPRVLVVEDDETLRETLCLALRNERYEVHAEPDGLEIARVEAEFCPDLAILDVRLPVGPDGCDIARRLHLGCPDLPVLFLTVANGLADRLAGFAAGADDYVAKPFVMEELLARVWALLRRSGRLQDSVWRLGDLAIDRSAHTVTRGGHVLDLAPLEYAVLDALARHHGQTLSKGQLLRLAWGEEDEGLGANRVEAQISRLRRHLEAHGPRIIHTVFKAGYVLRVCHEVPPAGDERC